MTPLEVELLPRRSFAVWVAWAGTVVVLTSAAAVAVWDHHWRQQRQEYERLIGERKSAQAAPVKIRPTEPKRPVPYLEDARALAESAQLDVGGVLRQLEAAVDPAVKLVSLDIDVRGLRVRLEIEASSGETVVRYIAALNRDTAPKSRHWQLGRISAAGVGEVVQAVVETSL